jgi:halocyanin-like protein
MKERDSRGTTVRRRSFIRAGLVAGAGLAGGTATVAAQSEYGGWLSDVGNYDGTTVDRTGQDEVTIRVGTEANGGAFGFGPPAVRVSPGTTVVWRWTGAGGQHNVVDNAGNFESELTDEAGFVFEYTFEESGIYKYYCAPHESLGMKGAVAVGDVGRGEATPTPTPEEGGGGFQWTFENFLFGAFFGVVGLTALGVLGAEGYGEYRDIRDEQPEKGVYAQETPVESPEEEIGHDEYDPWGTATLVAAYFAILVLLWIFMYFVEFLGNGPTVVG